ncbi:MAG TPA: Ivy family c-type lysozyme inhibitor [Quisquiliibacterium sp.]|nr:Ivy family c-type lysozyme inhibitor [Quisquiliibacterium sp.]
MPKSRPIFPAVAAGVLATTLAAAALPARARLDPATEGRYGGVYSNDCNGVRALRVRFYEDLMAVERDGKAVNANRVRVLKTHPTAAAAPDFKAVIQGEVKGGDGLVFVLHHNADGLFAVIDGGEKSLAALGPGVQGQKLRHCDPNRNPLPGAAPPPSAGSPRDLLKDDRFRTAWTKAAGPLARERWIARLDGPAPELRKANIAGTSYTVGASCKPHDCGENNLVLLYDAAQGGVLGLVHQAGRNTLIGDPSPAMAAELEKLWRQEWRQGR